jgi:hypothetical protein
MTADLDRCQALEMLGYTARQPQFLVRVALHGGYFLRRQYVTFTGIAHGQATVRFLARCVAREHVRVLPYGRDGHVFHLSARPLYAAIGEEDNRNRRPAEWDAVLRKLMTLDFALAHPTARFLATEAEKVAVLRERLIPSVVWPHRSYPPRRTTGCVTTRYFVDKMPWYQHGDETRVWIAYVDTERTLQGFQTFLDQYRALLASLPSGVTYVAPTAWHGVIQSAFTKGLESRDPRIMSRFREYCDLRHAMDEAHSNWRLTPDQRRWFREQSADFLTPAFDALYKTFLETSSISSTDVAAAAFPPVPSSCARVGSSVRTTRSRESTGSPTGEVT